MCLQACWGGEVSGLSKLSKDTQRDLIEDASAQAKELGANAIIGIGFQTNTVFEGTVDVIMYGTAVKVHR